jgi:uncharacterized phage-like protein YoqJ
MKELIEMSRQLTDLLVEYEFAKQAEAVDYFIDQIEFRPASPRERFGVIRKSDGHIMFYDTLSECERYCTKRKLTWVKRS